MRNTVRTLLAPLAAILRRLSRRRDGSVAVLFALAAIPVIIAAGMAIDTARAYMVKTRLGAALDAAALAVGSQSDQPSGQLTTDLKNYFYDNYCKSVPAGATVTQCANTVASETNISVAATSSITSPTVTFRAQASVPTMFMRLVGVDTMTVSVTAQTTKFPGMEIAVVLDNTGSMLCGPNDNAPNYDDSDCSQGAVPSDTTCTNPSNQSRICTLINAAKQFVTTLQNAITAPQSIYMAIVPYVTTVNVGDSLCTGPTSCSDITTDSCSGDFTNETGSIIYNSNQTPITVSTTSISVRGANTTSGSTIVTNISNGTSSLSAGMPISGAGIRSGATIASVDSATQIHLSSTATSSGSGRTLTATEGGASTTSGSNIVTFASPSNTSALSAGMVVTGNSIPASTAIKSVDSTTQIHICNNATATASYQTLKFYAPITFDSTYNTATPLTASTTTNWGGCVIEPTSSDENSGVSGVINSSVTDPDTSEPSGGWPSWYPFWWNSGSGNNWSSAGAKQNTSDEIQGTVVGTFDQLHGPNEGCPAPLLPLTDLTTASGQTTILNEINSMWPRDSGGTQVDIGLIWGWRALSPNGPFAANNGHPLDYATATAQGWKKIIVLMTDGTEEWPLSTEYTGLGGLSDGKIGTTSSTYTAQSNLDTRLQTACDNLKASNDNGTANYMIYTIGLGSDGASNTTLQNCAGNGGFFSAATPSNLQQVFQNIANSIIHLRLTE